MATREEKQSYIDRMVAGRGYAQRYHMIMVEHDFDTMASANAVVEQVLIKDRLIDRKTKELIFIVGLTMLRALPRQIHDHMQVAVELGATKEEILEAIELVIPGAGYVAFQHGVYAWEEYFKPSLVEPSVDALEAFRARTSRDGPS